MGESMKLITRQTTTQTEDRVMKTTTNLKAGGINGLNHNESMKMHRHAKSAGSVVDNHNKGMKVRSNVKAGKNEHPIFDKIAQGM
jgi:hypothetical protein